MSFVVTRSSVIKNKTVLHFKSESVPMTDRNLVDSLIMELLKCFSYYDGKMQGCAAIQLGIEKAAILVRYKKDARPMVLFNPKVLLSIGERDSNEGCLSEDGRFIVKRPVIAVVSFNKENGKRCIRVLRYRKARIFCHECDHVNGILLEDHGKKVSV